MQKSVKSWTSIKSHISLQVLSKNSSLRYDSRGRETVEEFVTVLPQLVRRALYFDSCKVYLLREGALELRASDPPTADKGDISTDCDSDCFEAIAARQTLPMVLNHPKGIKR